MKKKIQIYYLPADFISTLHNFFFLRGRSRDANKVVASGVHFPCFKIQLEYSHTTHKSANSGRSPDNG